MRIERNLSEEFNTIMMITCVVQLIDIIVRTVIVSRRKNLTDSLASGSSLSNGGIH